LIISLIAALDIRDGIGKEGRVPWHLRADLKQFKSITMGHHILMGRKTYESIGRSLPGRTAIILTRNEAFSAPGCLRAPSISAGFHLAEARGEVELFVIGGGQVFREALPHATQIYLTRVFTDAGCDVFFPDVDWGGWIELERRHHPQDAENDYGFDFMRLRRADFSTSPEIALDKS
jgi:dihydrofolate reductase